MPERRLVVRSIGTADAGIVRALSQVMPLAAERLAQLLYRAPAELMSGLRPAQAEQLATLLGQAGLDCEVVGPDQAIVPGEPEFEVALVVDDGASFGRVAALVMVLLGVDAATARDLICQSPAVLLGGVSAATVEALRQRFAAVGARLDAARPADCEYDVFVGDCSPLDRQRAMAALGDVGVADPAPDGPVLATGLGHRDAVSLWERLQRTALAVRIVNREFLRFDLLLESGEPGGGLGPYLTTELGVPAEVVPAVLRSLPLVVAQNLDAAELAAHLAAVATRGGVASGQCLCFDSFGVVLDHAGPDAAAVVRLLTSLGGVTPTQATESLRSGEPVPRPMTRNRARWLQQELASAGTQSRVVTR